MKIQHQQASALIKQNILKNSTVLLTNIALTLWVWPYVRDIGDDGVNAFLFLSIFPLGAMFAYFAFSYSNTQLNSTRHRVLADISTFIFLIIISFSISLAAMVGIISLPQLTMPFIVLSVFLIIGCIVYDFWDLFSNIESH